MASATGQLRRAATPPADLLLSPCPLLPPPFSPDLPLLLHAASTMDAMGARAWSSWPRAPWKSLASIRPDPAPSGPPPPTPAIPGRPEPSPSRHSEDLVRHGHGNPEQPELETPCNFQ